MDPHAWYLIGAVVFGFLAFLAGVVTWILMNFDDKFSCVFFLLVTVAFAISSMHCGREAMQKATVNPESQSTEVVVEVGILYETLSSAKDGEVFLVTLKNAETGEVKLFKLKETPPKFFVKLKDGSFMIVEPK